MKGNIIKITAILAAICLMAGCCNSAGTVKLIFETDMGNDVDDAVALEMIHQYITEGRVELLMVGLNKGGDATAQYVDAYNRWHSRPDIPIGRAVKSTFKDAQPYEFTTRTIGMTDENGAAVYPYDAERCASLPDAVSLYRKTLASAKNESITIASVGFSTNLALLLDTPADEYSPLTGKELVAKKVKLLSVMGCNFTWENTLEFNIEQDVEAAAKVFAEWPTEIVVSPGELGFKVNYHSASLNAVHDWSKHQVFADSWQNFWGREYDRPAWDPTAVLYAVEGADGGFTISDPMRIIVDEKGYTKAEPDAESRCRILSVTDEQATAMENHIAGIIARKMF